MMTRSLQALCLAIIAASTATTSAASVDAAERASLAVIVAKNFPIDNLSFGDLKRLYAGTPVVAGGKSLIPITYPKHATERVGFDQSVLGMSADEAGRYWVDRKIRGQSGPPKAVDSPDVVIRVVTKVEGAVGYVRPNAAVQGVKVLRIDGKLPSDPGYRVAL
jgi:hypothetical protein